MNAYTLMMAVILFGALMYRYRILKRTEYIYASGFIMFVIMGLRNARLIGNDTRTSYRQIFTSCGAMSWNEIFGNWTENYNFGFKAFTKFICNHTNTNYDVYIMVISAIVMISFTHLVRKYSVSPVQTFCYYWGLLLYIFMFSALKQALAMSILIFAFDKIIERRFVQFVILVLLAATFHFPALVFFPAYFLASDRMNTKLYVLFLGGVLTFTYIFRGRILQLMSDAYFDGEGIFETENVQFLRNKAIIMLVIIAAALVLRPLRGQGRLYKTVLMLAGVAVVFQTFCGYDNVFERLADYYFQFAVLLIPMIFEKRKDGIHHFTESSEYIINTYGSWIFCTFGVWRFASYITSQAYYFLPFVFFFKK